ncbi:hypothetical protein MRB53_038177 [Persea americana]|nr:hypothetical protein MRB53_038177 [Persea americana]
MLKVGTTATGRIVFPEVNNPVKCEECSPKQNNPVKRDECARMGSPAFASIAECQGASWTPVVVDTQHRNLQSRCPTAKKRLQYFVVMRTASETSFANYCVIVSNRIWIH